MLQRTYIFLSQFNLINHRYLNNIYCYRNIEYLNNCKYFKPIECIRCKKNPPIYDKVGIGIPTHCIECV